MRTTAMIIGVLFLLVGIVWMLQGLGIVGGSFMTGQRQWIYNGIGVFLVGGALVFWSTRRKV